jgi:hypothetical protein
MDDEESLPTYQTKSIKRTSMMVHVDVSLRRRSTTTAIEQVVHERLDYRLHLNNVQ